MPNEYQIDFVIPQGATGPTGPANGLEAYGGKYNDTAQTITLGLGTQSVIPLPTELPNLNTEYTTANSITVLEDGNYEINYTSIVSAAAATTLTFAVRVNGDDIPSTVISRLLSVGVGNLYSGSTIVSLNAGDVIDLAVSSTISLGVTLGTGVNASLTVKKLN